MELSLIQKIAVWALPLLFAITVHEVAHGFVASLFGDQTARLSGRLTLNPIKHIDLIGTIIVPALMLMVSNFVFGWAKPVPIDSRNLRNPRYDTIWIALAGPISNLLMAIFWGGMLKLGSTLNDWVGLPLVYMGEAGIMINLVLCVLNCLPLPPLDGGRVMANLLPPRLGWYFQRIEPYGFFILIFLMYTKVLSYIMVLPVFFLRETILQLFGLL